MKAARGKAFSAQRHQSATTPTCGMQLTIPAALMAGMVLLLYEYQLVEWNRPICVTRNGRVYFGRRDIAETMRRARCQALRSVPTWTHAPRGRADIAPALTVTAIFPSSGDSIGGKTLDITGTGFAGTPTVTVGGNAATNVVVNSATSITCTTPAGTAGLVSVVVDGVTLSNVYIYRGGTYTRPSTPTDTEKYVSVSGAGTHDGSSQANAYSLSEAISAATAGWRFNLAAGDYGDAAIRHQSGQAPTGTSGAWIIWRKDPAAGSQPILRGVTGGGDYGLYVDGDRGYIVFDDLHVILSSAKGAVNVVNVVYGHHVHVVNCTLDGGATDSTSGGGGISFGSTGNGATDCWAVGNTISGIGDIATGNSGDGIAVRGGAGARVSANNYLIQNTITTAGHSAIDCGVFAGSSENIATGTIIAYNRITNPWAGGIIHNGKAHDSIIECNDISDAGTANVGSPATQNAILLYGDDNIVRYNRCWNCDTAAIQIEATSFAGFAPTTNRNKLYHNTLYDCNGMAFTIVVGAGCAADTHCINNEIENNLGWQNNQDGTTATAGYYSGAYHMIQITTFNAPSDWTSGLGGNVFNNNSLARTTSAGADNWLRYFTGAPSETGYSLASFESTFTDSSNNQIDVDPSFMDAASEDFTIATGSAVVDDGKAITGVTSIGSAPDLGVYEVA